MHNSAKIRTCLCCSLPDLLQDLIQPEEGGKEGRSVLEHVDHVDFLLVTSLFAAEVRFFHLSLTSEVVLFSTATAFTAAVISAQNFIFLGVCHPICEFGL